MIREGFPGHIRDKETAYQCKRDKKGGLTPESGDPLEKEMVTHSSLLPWRIPMDRRAWRATVHGVTKSQKRRKQFSMHMIQRSLIEAGEKGGEGG